LRLVYERSLPVEEAAPVALKPDLHPGPV
jgi:hypothetical protein